MLPQLYIVQGSTGDHERTEWLVAAYFDRRRAQSHAVLADTTANALRVRLHARLERCDYTRLPGELRRGRNPFDPAMWTHSENGDVEHQVVRVSLRETLPLSIKEALNAASKVVRKEA